MTSISHSRLRVAAISFLNPAPLMWDFEHPPLDAPLALRYQIDRMSPSECAARLAKGAADIGLSPIAALATICSRLGGSQDWNRVKAPSI